MRLVSQDGMIDVPYDKVVVKVTEHPFKMVISALFEREDCMKDIVMGYYSTEAKALKVMEMLREEYLKYLYGAGGEMATRDLYIQPFAFLPTKVFKFPKDEDVEV